MMNGGPISWKSRRQDNVSVSTSEAEFVAASHAGQEALYLRETLKDFGYQQQQATEIYEDNLACVAMSEIQCAENSRATSTFAVISCADWSKLGLSNSSHCARIKWSPMPSPRVYLRPPSSATAAS